MAEGVGSVTEGSLVAELRARLPGIRIRIPLGFGAKCE